MVIKAEEEAKICNIMKGGIQNEIDKDEKPKDCLHPAEFVRIIETPEDEEIQIYTDGIKNENGVGAGIAIFDKGIIKKKLKYKLHNNCSNNQAEQFALVKAMEAWKTQTLATAEEE